MARLARSSAGRQVTARAHRLSDRLLAVEEKCFRDIDRRIAAGSSEAAKKVRAAIPADGNVSSLARNARLRRVLGGSHRNFIDKADGPVTTLLQKTVDLTIQSIGEELAICERTLAKKYDGIAEMSKNWAESIADDMMEQAFETYRQRAADTGTGFDEAVKKQLLLAKQHDDTPAQVMARLFSKETVTLPGIGGRGIWYRSSGWLAEAGRTSSITLMNSLRTSAMLAFNEYGDRR